MIAYPVEITPDGEGFLIRFPDVPEAITFGQTTDEAIERARDALESALITYVDARKSLPEPSTNAMKQTTVGVSALSEAKLSLYALMIDRGVAEQDLARRMRASTSSVQRLLDLRVESPLSEIESAFRALDRRLTIQIVDAA